MRNIPSKKAAVFSKESASIITSEKENAMVEYRIPISMTTCDFVNILKNDGIIAMLQIVITSPCSTDKAVPCVAAIFAVL